LIHVTGGADRFSAMVSSSPQAIMASTSLISTTRTAEVTLGLNPSIYFFAGRAYPQAGGCAFAFGPECEPGQVGSATPFDTGGLVNPKRYIKIDATSDADIAAYGKASIILLTQWRDDLAQVLAAYFDADEDYWQGIPARHDLDGLYARNPGRDSWRAWTFEIRFTQPQPLAERVAWCADEVTMGRLRKLQDAQPVNPDGDPPTVLDLFLDGPEPLEPSGSPIFGVLMEAWAREEATR